MEIPKKTYQAPALTVVEFKIEQGFAASTPQEVVNQINWMIETEAGMVHSIEESQSMETARTQATGSGSAADGYWGTSGGSTIGEGDWF